MRKYISIGLLNNIEKNSREDRENFLALKRKKPNLKTGSENMITIRIQIIV